MNLVEVLTLQIQDLKSGIQDWLNGHPRATVVAISQTKYDYKTEGGIPIVTTIIYGE